MKKTQIIDHLRNIRKQFVSWLSIIVIAMLAVILVVAVLISALLTAGYLLPIMVDGYFTGGATGYENEEKAEPNALMLVPLFILCGCSLLVGLFGSIFAGSLVF